MEDNDALQRVVCDICGESNTPGSQYCIYCGRVLSRRAPPQQVSEAPVVPEPEVEEIVKEEDTQPVMADSDKNIWKSHQQTQQNGIIRVTKDSPTKSSQKSQAPPVIQKDGISGEAIGDKRPYEHQIEKQSSLSEISKFITRRTAIIGICSFSFALLIIITLSGQEGIERISVGLILLSFLLTVLFLVYDILKGRNYTEWSALGATISYLGIILIFIPLVFYVILPTVIDDVLVFIVETSGIFLLATGVFLRWTEYDEKLVNLITIAIGYWKSYQKREAIKVFLSAVVTFFSGLIRSIAGGFRRFPRRFINLLGMIGHSFVTYVKATVGQLINAFTRIFKGFWNNLHWIGLLAVFTFLLHTYLSSNQLSYQNIEILIIMSFFFVLGILVSNSEKVVKAVRNTRTVILKGAINAYSMLSGAKIKKEDSLFCSRCLRGVHKVEFVELQHVEERETPLCPFCGYENWVLIS